MTGDRALADRREAVVRWPRVAVFRFEGELIVNERVSFDASTMLAQLGLV